MIFSVLEAYVGAMLGHVGAMLEPGWGILGPCWGILGFLGGFWGRLRSVLGHFLGYVGGGCSRRFVFSLFLDMLLYVFMFVWYGRSLENHEKPWFFLGFFDISGGWRCCTHLEPTFDMHQKHIPKTHGKSMDLARFEGLWRSLGAGWRRFLAMWESKSQEEGVLEAPMELGLQMTGFDPQWT